jgi:hypothetical protein
MNARAAADHLKDTMTTDTTPAGHDAGPCKPLNLDFANLAAYVTRGEAERGPFPGGLRSVEHALGHLREETGLTDRQIAAALFTADVLLTEIILKVGAKWNGIATCNWLALCAERLWDAAEKSERMHEAAADIQEITAELLKDEPATDTTDTTP